MIAYDPDGGTSHLNPVYEKDATGPKGFDVVLHDECSADVKDLKGGPSTAFSSCTAKGLPGVVVHCGRHSYRSEGWPQKVTPWFEFTGLPSTGHGAQLPIAVSFLDKDNPIIKPLQDWTHDQRGTLQT